MGYSSKVGIMCEPGAYYLLKEAIDNGGGLKPDTIKFDGVEDYFLEWGWTKWYSDYPEIKAIEDVLRRLNNPKESDPWYDDFESYRYHMIRVGEESGDIEEKSNEYCFDFSTTTIFDVPGTMKEVA